MNTLAVTGVHPAFDRLSDVPLAVLWTMAPTGEVVEISDSVEELRGIAPDHARTQSPDQIHPPESLRASLAYFERFSRDLIEGRTPPVFEGQLEYFCADGSVVLCDVVAVPIMADDGSLVELRGVSAPVPHL